jgi:ribosome-binding ATPase YchF (GTP1/OBG family)
MLIGLVGSPNSGKSTFFKAATMIDVEIASYAFTTIKPNQGVGYVTAKCPCKEMKVSCNPQNSKCVDGTRLIPVRLFDVAGLVPGAHEGKGLGNQFLDDLRQASALIHVLDCSGKTNAEGKDVSGYDPSETINFLENEIDKWIENILKRGTSKNRGTDFVEGIVKRVTGLGITEDQVKECMNQSDDLEKLAVIMRKLSKPMMIAANKIDLETSEKNLERIKSNFKEKIIVPCSAEIECALKKADQNGLIEYISGSKSFKTKKEMNDKQQKALDYMRSYLEKWNGTGVQDCLNKSVYDLLGYIVIYPVEDENKLTNSKNQVFPDAHLVPKGTTAKQFAGMIHTDLADKFIAAINVRTKMRMSADHQLENGDIIKIMAAR